MYDSDQMGIYMDDEFEGDLGDGTPPWSLAHRQRAESSPTTPPKAEVPKPRSSTSRVVSTPAQPTILVTPVSTAATVGPPPGSVFMQNKHTYGTPRKTNTKQAPADLTPTKPSNGYHSKPNARKGPIALTAKTSHKFGDDGAAPNQPVNSAPGARATNTGLQNATRFGINKGQKAYGEGDYHQKSALEKELIASRNVNKDRWVRKEPHDATFELLEGWGRYMMSDWKKLEVIGFQTGAFIAWPRRPNLKTLFVWGSDEKCTAAVTALGLHFGPGNALYDGNAISRSGATAQACPAAHAGPSHTAAARSKGQKPKLDDKWATMHSTINHEQITKTLMKDLEKDNEAFVTSKFDHDFAERQGCFVWPADEFTIEEAFGNRHRLEPLDSIRQKCRCYIDYESSMGVIRVSADPELTPSSQGKAVTDALLAIRRQVSKIILDQNAIGDTLLKSSHVQAPSVPLKNMRVVLEDRGAHKTEYQVPVLTFQKAANDLSGFAGNSETGRSTEIKMRVSVKNILPTIQLYRGILRMIVNFGTFRLTGYRVSGKTYTGSVDEFRNLLADENTKGNLYPDLNGVGLKERCMQATKLLIPYESSSMTLQDAKLRYSAEFVFPSDGGNSGVYQTTYTRSQHSKEFERESKGWCIVPDSKMGSETQLDVSVVDFERCSWALQLTAMERIDHLNLSPPMRAFQDSVRLSQDVKGDIYEDEVRKFEYTTTKDPKYIKETMSYKFRLAQDPNYVLEIYRHDTFGPKSTIPRGTRFGFVSPAQQEPQMGWGVSLSHQEWDNKFGENKIIGPGETVTWNPTLYEFFPASYDNEVEFVTGEILFHKFFKMVESVAEGLDLKGGNVMKDVTASRNEPNEARSIPPSLAPAPIFSNLDGAESRTPIQILPNGKTGGKIQIAKSSPKGKKMRKKVAKDGRPEFSRDNNGKTTKSNIAGPSGTSNGLNLVINNSKNWAEKNWIGKD